MPTFTALTTLTGRDPAYALGEAMERLIPEPTGVGVFEVEDGSGLWEVGGYFEEAPDTAALAVLAKAMGAKDFTVSELPETDWVAHVRRELAPVEAGRFFVYGSHDADKVPDDCEPLLIEAAMAFGTGHHGTTLGCLRALDRLAGEGFHGKNEPVLASDIDEVAVEVAQANVDANNLSGRVACVEAAGFDHPQLAEAAPFDLVFANILKGPLVALAPDMAGALQPAGYAILSGLLNEQADEVIEVYARSGINLMHRESIGDWTTLTLQNNA